MAENGVVHSNLNGVHFSVHNHLLLFARSMNAEHLLYTASVMLLIKHHDQNEKGYLYHPAAVFLEDMPP
jgi:hypothetical protein